MSTNDEFTQGVLDLKIGPNGETFQEYVQAIRIPMASFEASILQERGHQVKMGNTPTPESVGYALASDLSRVLSDLKIVGSSSRPGNVSTTTGEHQ